MKKKLLILCPYPHGTAASQRFRFEQYIPALEQSGFEVTQASFWDDATWSVLYQSGHYAQKIRGTITGFGRRLALALRSREYDYVFIHLEATPLGPPIVETLMMLLRRRLVYDIDDAIFMARTSRSNRFVSALRWRSKVGFVARHSYKVTAVNPFLEDWAKQFSESVILVPTTIDPDYHRPPADKALHPIPVVGWTGSHSTAPYLELLRPVLAELQSEHPFRLRVICDTDPGFSELEDYEFVRWREETEIPDLQAIDIGLMPVPDTTWARGKVGFKAIQYSAVGIPPIVSDVGSGREVVDDGRTGLVVPNEPEAWREAIASLIVDAPRRQRMGEAARAHVLARYSIPAQTPTYLGLFQ